MAPRVSVPKIFRRGNRWYTRVQVPLELHKAVGRKEYWISLGTEDRVKALSLAVDATKTKRNEIDVVLRKLRGEETTLHSLTDAEMIDLAREVYADYVHGYNIYVEHLKTIQDDDKQRFVDEAIETLSKFILRLVTERTEHPTIVEITDWVLEENLIRLDRNGASYRKLKEICADAFIEGKRRQVSRLRGEEFPSTFDPRFVDRSTGEDHSFSPLREQITPGSENANRLSALIERYLSNPNKHRTPKTIKSIRGYLSTVIEILGDTKGVETITNADCQRVRDLIIDLPPNFSKHRSLRGLPIEEKVKVARAENMPRLSPTGVNNYLRWLIAFLNWCEGSDLIGKVPIKYELLKVADPVKRQHKRLPFSSEQLQKIFGSDLFASPDWSNSIYWVSQIALWNGMRSNEICQLDVADIVQEQGIWCFDVADASKAEADDKSLKTSASMRVIPIHEHLVELGFLRYHAQRPATGKLFGDISLGNDGYYSTTFSKRSNRYLKKVGVHGPKHKFHSLRHNFRDALRRGKVDPGIAKALGGWTGSSTEAFEIYGEG